MLSNGLLRLVDFEYVSYNFRCAYGSRVRRKKAQTTMRSAMEEHERTTVLFPSPPYSTEFRLTLYAYYFVHLTLAQRV